MLRLVFHKVFIHNFYLKFVAAILTLSLYIWVSEDRETIVAGTAPIRLVIPEDMILVSEPLDRIKVTIRGRWSDINRFDPSQLDAIRINLSPADQDTVVPITTDMVRVPPGLRVVSVEPGHLLVQLERETQKSVTIVPQLVGEPGLSYAVGDVSVTPEEVTIRGPRRTLDPISVVSTEPIDVSGRSSSFQKQVRLRLDHPHLSYDIEQAIIAHVDIISQEITRTFDNIPVQAVNTTHETTVSPGSTQITVRGPLNVVEAMRPDIIRAELDMTEEDQRPAGTFSKEVLIRNLPPGVTLEHIYPSSFRVTTTPR